MTERSTLVLIEFQREWLDENGKIHHLMQDKEQFQTAIASAKQALEAARQYGIKVVHCGLKFQQGHPELGQAQQTCMNNHSSNGCIANCAVKLIDYLSQKQFNQKVTHRATQEEWVIALVAAGLGITIMPEWKQEQAIVFIPISDLPLQRTIGLIWRMGQTSPIIDEFRVFASSHQWQ